MSLLLHINTALEKGYVALSENDRLLAFLHCEKRNEQSAFLHPAIQQIHKISGVPHTEIHAVSVINGPGSYTGLRVGLAAAKGICYAQKIPLICISTLRWMAQPFQGADTDYICTMIDARRMEVFMAMYDPSLNQRNPEQAYILEENSFSEIQHHRILFTGNGRDKIPDKITSHSNAIFPANGADIKDQLTLALQKYNLHTFSDIMYTEPYYLKSFYSASHP